MGLLRLPQQPVEPAPGEAVDVKHVGESLRRVHPWVVRELGALDKGCRGSRELTSRHAGWLSSAQKMMVSSSRTRVLRICSPQADQYVIVEWLQREVALAVPPVREQVMD